MFTSKKIFAFFIFLSIFLHVFPVSAEERKIAVLPFDNLSKDKDFDWVKEAISETLTTKFANAGLPTLERSNMKKVLEEISLSQSSDISDEKTAIKVGQMHGAGILVIGAFQKSGSVCRITARLVDTETGEIIKAVEKTGSFDGASLFKLQDEVAYALIGESEVAGKFKKVQKVNYDVYNQVVEIIKKEYVHDIDLDTSNAPDIEDLINQIDEFSSFQSKKEVEEMKALNSQGLIGIGITIRKDAGTIVVINAIGRSPASRAGIRSGDSIVEINGESTKGMSLIDVVFRIRGTEGTSVTLKILTDEAETRTVSVIREKITFVSVDKSKMLDKRTAYIKMQMFSTTASQELLEELKRLKKKGMRRLILDLRNNSGGMLQAGWDVADIFLNKGRVLARTETRLTQLPFEFKSENKKTISIPVVILINKGTSGTAEIVSAALKDNKRATLMGERTFGIGRMDGYYPLVDGSALRFTIAFYLTPESHVIEKAGVEPDIVCSEKEDDLIKRALEFFSK